jgi:hypothetical protein
MHLERLRKMQPMGKIRASHPAFGSLPMTGGMGTLLAA